MAQSSIKIPVYLEIGEKLTIAGALDWPGWCRSGRDADSALRSLFEYGFRYAHIIRRPRFEFEPPRDVSQLDVVERLAGDATTDFAVPGIPPRADARPVNRLDLLRFQAVLDACWKAFDKSVKAATGKQLVKGPRGGGRDLEAIVDHVLGADASYLGRLGWKFETNQAKNPSEAMRLIRRAIFEGLKAAAHGEIPSRGPRGGLRWTPRYFVRRTAYHVVDHTWEIENRVERLKDEG